MLEAFNAEKSVRTTTIDAVGTTQENQYVFRIDHSKDLSKMR